MADQKIILIVEDEAALSGALKIKLEGKGFLAEVASNGEEGLKKFHDLKPDLIMLDLIMPVMDGITMLKELRKDPAGKSVKVMSLSNVNDVEKVSKIAGLGVVDYIVKSDWKINDIVQRVADRLKG